MGPEKAKSCFHCAGVFLGTLWNYILLIALSFNMFMIFKFYRLVTLGCAIEIRKVMSGG